MSDNPTEGSIRHPLAGWKVFGGCRSRRELEVAGLFYSLLGSAKLARVDPRVYLREMAGAAIRGEELLLPHEFAAAQSIQSDE